jgi:hypothetical protein
MDLIERLRPKWRHPDPEVRATAVRELDADDQRHLAEIARGDTDARVRRIAIKKVRDADLLEQLATSDAEPSLRDLAAERARDVLVAIASAATSRAEGEAALARLVDEHGLAAVATGAALEPLRLAALARISSERVLRDVVRGASDATLRRAALDRIEDAAVLRSLAVSDLPAEIALHALERIDDAETLRGIAEHPTASKHVRQRARTRLPADGGEVHTGRLKEGRARQLELCTTVQALRADADVMRAAERTWAARREWRDLTATVPPRDDVAEHFAAACDAILGDAASLERRRAEADHLQAAFAENVATRATLCEGVEELAGAAALRDLATARGAWNRLVPVAGEQADALARRFVLAGEACEARHRRWREHEAQCQDMDAMLTAADALADASPVPSVKEWKALEKRWTSLTADVATSEELAGQRRRFTRAGERLERRREDGARQQAEAQQENRARLDALCARLGELAHTESIKPATARRALQAAEAALADLGPLPAGERRGAWAERLTAAQAELLRRVRQEEETEQWRRWANVSAQEEIIQRTEALLETNDVAEGTRVLPHLQEEWEAVATATPEKSQALWERFKVVRNELRRRCDAYLDENVEKKRALCAQVTGVGESTDWNDTAELVRRLQSEWKAIGPVPARQTQALWHAFREPCDRFFARRKEHFERIDGERRENAKQKTALCEQAEALADSVEWDATAAAIKNLQGEWKRSGPPPRAEADALWQRFRAACDRFFDRHRRRHELAREELRQNAETICVAFEALAAAPGDDVGRQLDEAWGEWMRVDIATVPDAPALQVRVHAACEQLVSAHPESLRGTRLDPAATHERRAKLVARLEALSAATPGAQRAPSLQEMAMALRDRLATNTIAGGKGSEPVRRQNAAEDVTRIIASWARLGPVLGEEARALAERFERARAAVRGGAR